jgi:hypothetical protein|tara:strand:+ start:72197 stop:72715 length:519 start_codon:yes stop_codon:yes gene_type:complete
MDYERIRNKKLSRLCLNFKEQAQDRSLDAPSIWVQAETHPWIDSHPWADNGIPTDLDNAVFNVQSDIREEFARVTATYDPAEAQIYADAALAFRQLFVKQAQVDMDFLLKRGDEQQQRAMLHALNRFYETHSDDVYAAYYDTRAIGLVSCMARNTEVFLEQGYQAVYGTRNF